MRSSLDGAPGARRGRIGIITGSGPEAGIDLWQKILAANRLRLGADYAGDVSAPHVVVLSVPELGLSMDLERHAEVVWRTLEGAVREIVEHVDCFAIACNTLNYFEPEVRALAGRAEFVSVGDVVRDYLESEGLEEVALLGARPALDLTTYSPYRSLAATVSLELPADLAELHSLIHDVKRSGATRPDLRPRFERILQQVHAEAALLACTELPLIATDIQRPRLVDVTDLLAHGLVDRALDESRVHDAVG